MKSFAVLITLAILTECLGADRSRQRSSIRSVPVATSAKRVVDFDCPEEFGYYPHPTDCTLYYVCVFGGALLESCTGGLMYSHELQTCDWPRNVGCDATGAVINDDYERLSERRQPPPPPPRRNPPPPPPSRAQPNPVITSRGQPKYNRQEYEKQQQLYAEVDDLPPVEEIESDRQQRVYRGQPSTIGQVQKDRDGYHGAQGISSGRTLNSNIIPSSIAQNSKIGSFSFGTQVDDRRTATATQTPQTYRGDMFDVLTDSSDITKDFSTGESIVKDLNDNSLSRKKREVVGSANNVSKIPDEITKKSDDDEEMEYIEFDPESDEEDEEYQDDTSDESERGKRQIRFYFKDGRKIPVKFSNSKPLKFVNLQHYNYNPKIHNPRYQSIYNSGVNGDSYNPFLANNNNQYSVNPVQNYHQIDSYQNQRPFKASLRDPSKLKYPLNNPVTQVITKSPPISSLNNNQNPFASLAGGFFNNGVKENTNHNINTQGQVSSTKRPNLVSFPDSSQLSSAIVTGRPVPSSKQNLNVNLKDSKQIENNTKDQNQMTKNQEYNEDSEEYSDEDDSAENDDDDKHKFSTSSFNIPYSFTNPRNKYANIDNPFAKPDFDFDEFLAKLRGDHYSALGVSTQKPKPLNNVRIIANQPAHTTPSPDTNKNPSIYFKGISTPKPFTVPDEPINNNVTLYQNMKNTIPNQILISQQRQRPQVSLNNNGHYFQDNSSDNSRLVQKDAGVHFETLRPKLQPPNFKDDTQLPISYSFNTPTESSIRPPYPTRQTVTQTPYYTVTKNNKIATLQPNYANSMKPYLVSTSQPMNLYVLGLSQSTPRPSTYSNEQLSALQNYWKTPSTGFTFSTPPSISANTVTEIAKWTKLYLQALQSSTMLPLNNKNTVATTTAKAPPKRKLIPKPSPEMNDYYYDEEDEQYYYEPAVKSKYMPSSEVMPQRPPMAQNYLEYDDSHEHSQNPSKQRVKSATPNRQNYNPKGVTKNHNDVSVVTKSPYKQSIKNNIVKIPVPVMVDFDSSINSMIHLRNRTYHIRKPNKPENNPNTLRPPKYLNQTTLRPYTVRHRLAKPTTEKDNNNQEEDNKQNRGRIRHHNIVAEMRLTTPHDSSKQETRITKTSHDDKTNSLEPTESVIPSSYSPSPRPKMLYNGSQSYSPDQYDPYYAVYDEDGELYKDTDYVQQYNTASLRPAVQQTYRGTPPPARRPVETYSPRPVADVVDDYDDALIRGPIINQNQYQTSVRQPARGEGNELGYDPIPTSVRTTVYEATFPSTTPTTTSTSTTTTTTTTTTTRRPTTAPYTEAMTPSRYSPRSSTDENRSHVPASTTNPNLFDESTSSIPTTLSPTINLSSLAKPFERTDNAHRLHDPSTEITTRRPTTRMTNNNKYSVKLVHQDPDVSNKKVISLTTGFSIRRNVNNTQNPYTLTIISKPFDSNNSSAEKNIRVKSHKKHHIQRLYYDVNEEDKTSKIKEEKEVQERESDDSTEKNSHSDSTSKSVSMRSSVETFTREPRNRYSTIRTTATDDNKYYLKSILKRPVSELSDSTENSINSHSFLNTQTESPNKDSDNTRLNLSSSNEFQDPIEFDNDNRYNDPIEADNDNKYNDPIEADNDNKYNDPIEVDNDNKYNDPIVSPYKILDNLRNNAQDVFSTERNMNSVSTSTVSTSTQDFTSNKPKATTILNKVSGNKPSYYLYHVEDDVDSDQTTEVFKSSVKHLIRHFIKDLYTSTPKVLEYTLPSTTSDVNEEVVNIGFKIKKPHFNYPKPSRSSFKHVSIITEPSVVPIVTSTVESIATVTDPVKKIKHDSVQTAVPTITHLTEVAYLDSVTDTGFKESAPSIDYEQTTKANNFKSKFSSFKNDNLKFDQTRSHKFKKIIQSEKTPDVTNKYSQTNEHTEKSNLNEMTKILNSDINTPTEPQIRLGNDFVNDIASTTSTTKSTTTVKTDFKNKQTTKSLSFPTRASRINPAIKLAAASLGGGRRSYQSSNCSSDNSLQVNPKCNEIKYQRPTSTRGRGSAHFSTSGGSDAVQQNSNRGTPPTRSRLTLKPSTAIITKSVEKDIYANPPARPEAVYPQPTPDKTAAKCRKDVCLLPDCFCGGKDIPGNLPVNEVPQIVLLTFDDAVNDLNKMYYEEFFERGRVNPNGCPITSTFYVSHEWTDYSQVQNLYADGHEFASHTISHSFGEQFSQKKWHREVGGQREILAAYGGVKLEDVRGMRAPFLSVGGNKMFKMLYDSNFTYDSSLPVYENRPPSWPYTLDYKLFHDCMIPPCPTKSYPGVWEVPMVMWQDLNGGRCSMGDACANPPDAEGVYKMILKNFDRHYESNRAPFGLFYHAAWFTQPHHKEGFIMFLDFINKMNDVWIVTNWQALQWVRDPTPISRLNNFQPFQCNYPDRPKKCNNPKVCNLWHKSGVRYMRSCQPCPQIYPWTGKTGISSSRIDKEIEE